MDATLELVILLAIGFLAGIVNTLAGGGSLFTLPILIFLGLPPQIANGTNRVVIVAQSLSAVVRRYSIGLNKIFACEDLLIVL